MNWGAYVLKGFGYNNAHDFADTVFGLPMSTSGCVKVMGASATLSAMRLFIKDWTGLDGIVFVFFVLLIIAEFLTGLKVSKRTRGERFKSRKFGRMVLKIGVYLLIISMLYAFAKGIEVPVVMGLQVNPFMWLYYMVFISIVFQLFISWMENLGALGYSETKTIAGFVLRKLNKWFEFDGTKDNGPE